MKIFSSILIALFLFSPVAFAQDAAMENATIENSVPAEIDLTNLPIEESVENPSIGSTGERIQPILLNSYWSDKGENLGPQELSVMGPAGAWITVATWDEQGNLTIAKEGCRAQEIKDALDENEPKE